MVGDLWTPDSVDRRVAAWVLIVFLVLLVLFGRD